MIKWKMSCKFPNLDIAHVSVCTQGILVSVGIFSSILKIAKNVTLNSVAIL